MRLANAMAAAALALPVAAAGQSGALRAQCADAGTEARQAFCWNVADAAVILPTRVGIAATGGNPVPGAASTLGMRLGSLPRMSLGLRVTAAHTGLPPVERLTSTSDVTFPVGSIAADAAVGLFQGVTVLPTVGGFGSIDLLGSLGVLPLPGGEGFDEGTPVTWSLGARLGVLRESFTAPGVSLSAMYRSVGGYTYGSPILADREAFARISDHDVWSLRGIVGKRLLGFSLTGGVGYDRYGADIRARVRDPLPTEPGRVIDLRQDGMTASRTSLFANASLTFIILNVAAEAGWQSGGDAPAGGSDRLERGALFGGLAIRLSI